MSEIMHDGLPIFPNGDDSQVVAWEDTEDYEVERVRTALENDGLIVE